MVDLVKIRKKAKKAAAETSASPAVSPEASEPPAESPVEVPAVTSAEPVGGEAAGPAVTAESRRGAQPSKLDRFREEAGRLRDAVATHTEGEERGDLGRLEVLSFIIAGEHYAADIERIVEIVTPRNITRVPNADSAIVGVVSLRGTMVTIVDIRSRLGHRRVAQTADARIIVVDHAGETIGFEVDRVLRVVKIDRSAVESHPVVHSSEMDDSIVGVFRHESALTILLDFDKLLAAAAPHA